MISFPRWTLLVVVVLNAGCVTYFKKKACEETNWHQHGLDVAMSGKRLDADPFFQECQKVEADFSFAQADAGFKEGMSKYCDSSSVFAVGKSGRPFSFDLCDGRSEKQMRDEHARGVRDFCLPSNGYPVGSSGQVYGKICPNHLEPAFLKEYHRGRRVYLKGQARENESEIHEAEMDLRRIDQERLMKQNELQVLMMRRQSTSSSVRMNPVTGHYESVTTTTENPETETMIRDLRWKIDSIDSDINHRRKSIGDLHDRGRRIRSELDGLENE